MNVTVNASAVQTSSIKLSWRSRAQNVAESILYKSVVAGFVHVVRKWLQCALDDALPRYWAIEQPEMHETWRSDWLSLLRCRGGSPMSACVLDTVYMKRFEFEKNRVETQERQANTRKKFLCLFSSFQPFFGRSAQQSPQHHIAGNHCSRGQLF